MLTTPARAITRSDAQPPSGSVGADAIASGAVDTTKLGSGAVDTSKHLKGSVTADQLGNAAVDTTKLASGAVDTSKLLKGAVTTDALGNAAVDTTKLGKGAVTADQIGSAAIDSTKLSLAKLGVGTNAPTTTLTVYGVVTTSSTIPTIACNAGTGVIGANATSNHGTFVAGSGAANCTVTFAAGATFPKTPDCICADDTSILALKPTPATGSLICTASVSMSGDTISYICMGAP